MMEQGLVTPYQQQDLINPLMPARQQKLSGIVVGLPEGCVYKFLQCLLRTDYYEPHKQLYNTLYVSIRTTEV